MKRCEACKETRLVEATVSLAREVAGRKFYVDVLGQQRCSDCGATVLSQRGGELAEVTIAEFLARNGPVNGETFRFMRKAIGLSGVAVGALLDVAKETISRWETGDRDVDRAAWVALSGIVIEHASGRHGTLDRLKILGSKARPRGPVHLKAPRAA